MYIQDARRPGPGRRGYTVVKIRGEIRAELLFAKVIVISRVLLRGCFSLERGR